MFCRPNKILLLSLSLLFILNSSLVLAAKKNKDNKPQTLDIKAQYLLIDENKGVSTYKGNVLLTKETLVIKADSITVYSDGEKLIKAFIEGTPADVQHHPDNEEKVHSQANNMEYFVNDEKLILKGQAFVNQGEQSFSGETIEYDTQQRTIKASGNKKDLSGENNNQNTPSNARVHVIIGPSTEQDDETDSEEESD